MFKFDLYQDSPQDKSMARKTAFSATTNRCALFAHVLIGDKSPMHSLTEAGFRVVRRSRETRLPLSHLLGIRRSFLRAMAPRPSRPVPKRMRDEGSGVGTGTAPWT